MNKLKLKFTIKNYSQNENIKLSKLLITFVENDSFNNYSKKTKIVFITPSPGKQNLIKNCCFFHNFIRIINRRIYYFVQRNNQCLVLIFVSDSKIFNISFL